MKNSTRILLTLLLGAALFAIDGYSADGKPKQATVITDADVEGAWQRRVPEIVLGNVGDNYPLAAVVEDLRRHFPELNFIVPESARAEMVPGLRLRSVTLDEILKAIEIASGGHIRGGVPSDALGIDANTGLPFRRTTDRRTTDNPKGNIVTFSVGPLPGSQASDRKTNENSEDLNRTVCRVFSLAPYLAYRSEKDADVAIRSLYETLDVAWTMLGRQVRDVHPPELKIHSGTKLLITVGRERELAVIEQVIKELQGSAPVKKVATLGENEFKPKAASGDAPPAVETKQ